MRREIKAEKGWPVGPGIVYECLICKKQVAIYPPEYQHCDCDNFSVDGDAGRIHVGDPANMRIYQDS